MNTVEYGTYVIDLTAAMLEHKQRLNDMQIDQIETIHRRAVQFVTEFLQHENAPLDDLLSYLNHDAMSPITIVIGFSEMLLMEAAGPMPKPFMEAMDEIRDCGYNIRDDIYEMQEELLAFMESIGMTHKSRSERADTDQDTSQHPQSA